MNLAHLLKLNLADPDFTIDHPVQVLVGADIHADIVLSGLARGLPREPVATSSHLSWYLLGRAPTTSKHITLNVITVSHRCACDNTFSKIVQIFWRQEEVSKVKIITPEEELCENQFVETTQIDTSGRYIVRLPFKQDCTEAKDNLNDSYNKATSVLKRME